MNTIIVACDQNNLIGKKGTINGMPWQNKEDLKHYRNTTLNHTMLMGRTTFEAIGKPLKKRKTIIVSRNFTYDHEDVTIRNDLVEVLKEYREKEEELFICGGASIYQQALPYVDKMLISRIPGDYVGDAYFPAIPDEFELAEVQPFETFNLEIYRRKK